jgi:hypothetical protein
LECCCFRSFATSVGVVIAFFTETHERRNYFSCWSLQDDDDGKAPQKFHSGHWRSDYNPLWLL